MSDEIDTKPLQLGPNVDPLQSIKLQLEVVAAEKSRVAEREDSKLQVSGGGRSLPKPVSAFPEDTGNLQGNSRDGGAAEGPHARRKSRKLDVS